MVPKLQKNATYFYSKPKIYVSIGDEDIEQRIWGVGGGKLDFVKTS